MEDRRLKMEKRWKGGPSLRGPPFNRSIPLKHPVERWDSKTRLTLRQFNVPGRNFIALNAIVLGGMGRLEASICPICETRLTITSSQRRTPYCSARAGGAERVRRRNPS